MLGTDIIEISRVEKSIANPSFFLGVFTDTEREYYAAHGSRAETLAGMFCAKEAVAKALGTGFAGFRPSDIEILHTRAGAPYAELRGKAKEKFPTESVEISISHCKAYAVATALVREKR